MCASDLERPEHKSIISSGTPIDQHPAAAYVASLSSMHSRRNMQRYLNQIAALLTDGKAEAFNLDWSAVRIQHVQAVRSRLMEYYAPATVNGMLSALRGVLKQAWQLNQMSSEDYHKACSVQNITNETLPTGRDLKQGEIHSLMATCNHDDTPAGVRDGAIIGVLYVCGLRRAELVALDLADCDLKSGRIAIKSGKGRKDRTVYAASGALDAVSDWIIIRGPEPGPLFMPINKGGRISRRRLSAQAIYNILKKRASQAGISDFSPHDFRRTFVGDLLDRGADIAIVQKLAGHASPTTTSRYDRRGEEIKRSAAQKLHIPYSRRRL